MPVLYSETWVTTQENTIIMTMTPVTAEMYLMVVLHFLQMALHGI